MSTYCNEHLLPFFLPGVYAAFMRTAPPFYFQNILYKVWVLVVVLIFSLSLSFFFFAYGILSFYLSPTSSRTYKIKKFSSCLQFLFSFKNGSNRLNPCPLYRQHRVLTTGPPGKSLNESFIYLLVFILLSTPGDMWDLSSPKRDRTPAPCIGSVES